MAKMRRSDPSPSHRELIEEFALLLRQDEAHLDLAKGALTLCKLEFPQLTIRSYLEKIDQIGSIIKERIRPNPNPSRIAAAINQVLFEELRFSGNTEDYYNPRNSFLNEVLDHRVGIPMTLSILFMELARKFNLQVEGINFPSHFLVKYREGEKDVYLDVFNKGRTLSESDFQSILDQVYGGKIAFNPHFLAPANKRQILLRMLNNLKQIYLTSHDYRKALTVVEMMLTVQPDQLSDMRDKGILEYHLRMYEEAFRDLQLYISKAPDAGDADIIMNLIDQIRSLLIGLR